MCGRREVNKKEENRERKEGCRMKDSCRKGIETRRISE
jgi:hypothetical protein